VCQCIDWSYRAQLQAESPNNCQVIVTNLVVYRRQVPSSQPTSNIVQLRISKLQPHQNVILLDQQVGAIEHAFQLCSPFTFGLLLAQRLCAIVTHTHSHPKRDRTYSSCSVSAALRSPAQTFQHRSAVGRAKVGD